MTDTRSAATAKGLDDLILGSTHTRSHSQPSWVEWPFADRAASGLSVKRQAVQF